MGACVCVILLQHSQEGRGLHIWDADLILVLSQLPVEHGMEHGTSDR